MVLIASHLLPRWLEVLLREKFYNACIIHEEAKKNEKNVYCLDCCISLCPHCLSPHRSHRLLQIRRYVYHDVIRLDDAAKLIDCAFVQVSIFLKILAHALQSYTTNSAKVVFLHQRPQTRNFRGSGNFCSTCDRSLQDPYLFCSLSCKIDHLIRTEVEISKYLFDCKSLSLPEPGLEDCSITADSVLEPNGSSRTSSGSGGCGGVDCRTLACTATTEVVRKKRTSKSVYGSAGRPVCLPVPEISASLMNRRKGTPQRAPLY
ncbi:protein RGF1 INDUCIBLE TRANSCRIPTION FACTOR 1-like isoform X1 [Juglans microcarpa x Juglans regia]|uniref:protein RGF1 INDUCIBLE TRANSCRIPTION FACTOR 1-like isoform X1 n=1 Tax=Juglans microcarpa x Juglans regia TaxID=2249226 RepID=UPI001B7E578C|nr:protein RGF1 INDUCIBLE TRANSCRIPTION FACTOR 1-like isoform X1 [Juglans microcarpa x Juglans regia]